MQGGGTDKSVLKTLVEFQALPSISLTLSGDGKWLTYGDGGSLFIGRWRNRAPHMSNVKRGPNIADLRILEWSPDSKYLLASSNRIVCLVEPENPTKLTSFTELEEAATAILGIDGTVNWLPGVRMVNKKPLLALRPDCQTLAMCAYQSQIGECLMVFRCEDWSLMWKVQSHCAFISGILWFTNSRAVFVWDSTTRLCVDFFHPDGSSKHTITPAKGTEEGIRMAAMAPCSSLLATFAENFEIHLHNTSIWKLITILEIRKLTNSAGVSSTWAPFLSWSACGHFLAFAASTTTYVTIWSKFDGDHAEFCIGDLPITDMAWHRKKPMLAVATGSRHVCMLKCAKPGMKNGGTLGIEFCKLESTIPVKELRWEGGNPSFLVVRNAQSHVAVTCIR